MFRDYSGLAKEPGERINIQSGYVSIHRKNFYITNHHPFSLMSYLRKDKFLRILGGCLAKDKRKQNMFPNDLGSLKRKRTVIEMEEELIVTYKENDDSPGSLKKRKIEKVLNYLMLQDEGITDAQPYKKSKKALYSKFYKNRDINQLSSKCLLEPYNIEVELIGLIKQHMPRLQLIDVYLEYFFDYLYPFMPFINKEVFLTQIKSIVNNQKSIEIIRKLDFAIVGTLFIILRLVHVSIRTVNDKKYLVRMGKYADYDDNNISPNLIQIVRLLMHQFDNIRRGNTSILIFFLYARMYTIYAPELGETMDGGDFNIKYTELISFANLIGLNKDGDYLNEMINVVEKNTFRKIWYKLIDIDAVQSVRFGCYPLISNQSYNTKLPNDENEILISKLIKLEYCVDCHILKIVRLLLNVKDPNVEIDNLIKLIVDLEKYAISNKLIDFEEFLFSESSVEENIYKFKNHLKIRNILVQVYYELMLHFEKTRNKESASKLVLILANYLLPSLIKIIPYLENIFSTPVARTILLPDILVIYTQLNFIEQGLFLRLIQARNLFRQLKQWGKLSLTDRLISFILSNMNEILKELSVFVTKPNQLSFIGWKIYNTQKYIMKMFNTSSHEIFAYLDSEASSSLPLLFDNNFMNEVDIPDTNVLIDLSENQFEQLFSQLNKNALKLNNIIQNNFSKSQEDELISTENNLGDISRFFQFSSSEIFDFFDDQQLDELLGELKY